MHCHIDNITSSWRNSWPSPLEAVSTLTERYQTTVPMPVRLALHLDKHDKVRYSIRENGDVVISRVVSDESDPVLSKFLNFLAQGIGNPAPSQVDAVWDVLKPARDHIEAAGSKPIRRTPEDTPGSLVTAAHKEVVDLDLAQKSAGQVKQGPVKI